MKTNSSISSLSLILILAISMIMAFAQPTLAQVGITQPDKTVGYISVAPLLVGVGQEATVNLWVFPMPTNYAYQPYYKGFDGVTVTFTKPDGTKDTFKPVDGTGQYAPGQTQSLGAIYFYYAPDMAGDWSVSFTMPAQNLTDSTGTVLYQACTSDTAHFTVQTEPVLAGLLNGYPWSPLPNDNAYWSYPINSNNREWSQISGEWLGGGYGTYINGPTTRLWQPYGSGPNTAHIVWKQPLSAGGIIGGDYGSLSYASALGGFSSVPIMQGKVFTNIPNENKFACIDLATGKILYTMDGQINVGLHLPGNPWAQAILDPSVKLESSYGSTPTAYLFGTTGGLFSVGGSWNFYDPFTGTLKFSIANVSSGAGFFAGYKFVDGTNLAYGTTYTDVYAWNMSKAVISSFFGTVVNSWPTGIEWTRPLPTSLTGVPPSLFGVSTDASTIVISTYNQYWGYSAKDGTSLWNLTLTYPVNTNEEICLYGVDDFIVFDPTETTFKCYSMLTGRLLWTSPSFKSSPWATTWTVYNSETNDYDNLYLMFPDGTMTALSLSTGKELWRSEPFPSTEYPNNAVPYVIGMVMVGGNIYGYAGYSTGYQINPIPRHAMLVCVNATTGNITWTLNGGVFPVSAAHGYVIGSGINDGNLYCVGKGKTQTTVTAPLTGVPVNSEVVIQGTVMDMSPASPNTPAVSDEDMSEWMDCIHMQNATLLNNPPKPKGVTVRLAAVDPNNNVIDIGTVTSDSSGLFGKIWQPEVPGKYTIYATFDGSGSYWGSYAATTIGAVEAAASVTPQPVQAAPDYTPLLYALLVVGIVAILLILFGLFRKRQ